MRFYTEYLTFKTAKHREYINITDQVNTVLRKSEIQEGMILVSAMHITAGVWVNDAEDGLIADMDGGGHAQIFLNHFHKVAVEVPVFNAVVIAIADEQERFALAGIEGDAVAGVEFSFFGSGSAKRFHEFAIFVELQDVVRAIAIGHKD